MSAKIWQRYFLMIAVGVSPFRSFADVSLEESIRRGAEFLLQRVEDEEEIWVLPPRRTRRRIGTEPVERRYREVTVEVPVYEMIREEVLVQRGGQSGGDVGGLVRRTRQVRGEQIGTRTVTRQVRDPEGPIVRTENRVIWGDGGPDQWMTGLVGQNALAALALLRSGHPDAGEAVEPMLEFFVGLVREHGAPDLTSDLAWLILLFAETDREDLHNYVHAMVAKLMQGQVRSGPAAGLWGPLAVSPEMLHALWQRFYHASFAYQELVERFGEDPRRDSERRRVHEAASAVENARAEIEAFTWIYRDFRPHRAWTELRDSHGDDILLQYRNPPEYLFNQQTADLESTWLALLAIRAARDRRLVPSRLPELPPPPATGVRRVAAPPPPPSPRDVVANAANALTRRAHPSGAFPEINLHQPVRLFDELEGIPGVPLQETDFPELPSPITLTATAQAFSAYTQVGRILGLQALRPHAPAMARARALLEQRLQSVVEGDASIVGGGSLEVLSLYLAFLDPGPDIPGMEKDLRGEAVRHLLTLQHENGSWRIPETQQPVLPNVWLHRIETLPGVGRAMQPHEYARPFTNFPREENPDRHRSRLFERFGRAQPAFSTAVALLILTEEARGTETLESSPEGAP